jgi:hypothetical protein
MEDPSFQALDSRRAHHAPRGSTDNKGQIMAHIVGVGELFAGGPTPSFNVVFLVEGERKEIGSDNLACFLEEHRARLGCDVIVISDTGMAAQDIHTDFFFAWHLRRWNLPFMDRLKTCIPECLAAR